MTSDAVRVLLVDDARPDFLWLEQMLRRTRGGPYRLDWLRRYPDALDAMVRQDHDLYLVDFRIGPDNGLDLIRDARHRGNLKPIIMLTGHGSERIDEAATEAGANDYLVKGEFDPTLLERAIRYATRNALALQDIRRLNAELEMRVAARTMQLQLMESAADHAADGIMVTDADLTEPGPRILYVNSAMQHLTGYGAGELTGRTPRILQGPGTSRQQLDEMLQAMRDGRTYSGELVNYTRSGAPFPNEMRIAPVRDAAGMVTHYISICRDVSQRNREAEMLRQLQKMEAVGQLTGGVAHDFNNLLTAIMGNIRLMQRRMAEDRPDLARFADAALLASSRAASLTQRLLAFARRQPLAARAVDSDALVAGMADMLRQMVGERVVVLTVLGARECAAWCDANQLESALLNLAINARDSMPDGGELVVETGCVTLSAAAAEAMGPDGLAPGGYVRLRVQDSGTGMTPAVLERVFEPFFSTKPTGQGTGLGLSQVFGFAKQSGGHVSIESEPGCGTTVTLYLPRSTEGVTPDEPAAAPGPFALRGTEAVLLVEDEPLVRALAAQTLSELGYKVLGYPSAEAALPLLASDVPLDALVTDVGLPGMNGRELAESACTRRPGLRVLLMTGYAHAAALDHGAPPGMHLLMKPFVPEALAMALRAALDDAVLA